jgi:septum formation inhibitor MinC
MQESENLPETIRKAQLSLSSYIKQRQEATHIRRVLAAHLDSTVDPNGHPLPRPLSLVDASCSVESTPHGVRGLQKEYLRCVRANINARREYAQICKAHHVKGQDHASSNRGNDALGHPMEDFLGLVKQQQKHEVLCIIQDYVDMLSQKPTAAPEFLDPKDVLKDVESLPQVPPEVLNVSSTQKRPGGVDLKDFVDQLEKSVLRAKLLLRGEQKLLAKVKSEQGKPLVSEAGKLQALGTTRNELINWIEAELSRAGESSPEEEDTHAISSPEKKSAKSIDVQLAAIQQQYSRYTKARQKLVLAATGRLKPQVGIAPDEETDLAVAISESGGVHETSNVTYPYLEELVAVSNEQKAIIQQKSHLTIKLAKQLKESSQSLERLAHESHLLPAHPMPTSLSNSKGPESSFGDEISKHEKPDSSRGARAWVYASESAANFMKEAILEKLEEGSMEIDESRQTMLELQRLLGDDTKATSADKDEGSSNQRDVADSNDIWSVLDGSLGVIKQGTGAVE